MGPIKNHMLNFTKDGIKINLFGFTAKLPKILIKWKSKL